MSAPYMPLYIADYLADTTHLTRSEPVHYVYVYAQSTYSGKQNAKIGVSKNPEGRRFFDANGYNRHGGYSLYKKFAAPTRGAAFQIEAAAKRHFKSQAICSELFTVTPQRVCAFIEKALADA